MKLKDVLRILSEFSDKQHCKPMNVQDAITSAQCLLIKPPKLKKGQDEPDENPVVEHLAKLLHKNQSDWLWEEASWDERDVRRSHAREVVREFDVSLKKAVR